MTEFTEGTPGSYTKQYDIVTREWVQCPDWWTWRVGELGVTRLDPCKCGRYANVYGDPVRIFRHFCEDE